MKENTSPIITVFHCVNALDDGRSLSVSGDAATIRTVIMPCSSMTRDVFLLRAFEAGADGVVVLVCPEGQCRHIDGNIRAARRVGRVKRLLDEIGLGGERLSIHNVSPGDIAAVGRILRETAESLKIPGRDPRPARTRF